MPQARRAGSDYKAGRGNPQSQPCHTAGCRGFRHRNGAAEKV